MSFLNSNNSEFLSARITNRGRKAIANGNFNIQYFQIGDSEYDYNLSSLTGATDHQKVFAPFDYDGGVKYPFGLDNTVSTTYGSPISNNLTITLRNEMGPAGFVSKQSTTPTVQTTTQKINYSEVSGSTSLIVPSGVTFNECEYITLVFDNFSGTTITGKTNSLIYKVLSVSGNTLNLDRKVPNLTSLTGNAQVVCNKCLIETLSTNLIEPIDYTAQLNSWRLNTVWSNKPIGGDYNGRSDESLSGYTSNQYTSIKNLLGYTTTGQTFNNFTGGTITGTTFKNSFDELIQVSPSEQRCIAIIHYSELGDISVDPERFFKYDDYISHKTGTTGLDISIVEDYDRENDLRDLSDSEYFQIYLPFIYYHRNTGTTFGAIFYMDTVDYYVKSSINSRHQIKFRYLVDEQNNKVGKVFVNNKIIVFDDQELVAMLDYRSNRRYTLPSPKLGLVSHDGLSSQSMLSTTGQTAWVTYMFENTSGNTLNSLPCNYFNKIYSTGTPSQITMKFSGNSFSNMVTGFTEVTDGFVANKFYALVQTGETPSTNTWKKIDLTSQITGYTSGYINPTSLNGVSFTINYTSFNSGSIFDLEDHMSGVTTDYLWNTTGSTTQPQFGDEQPFPGSVRLVRATDIEEMSMMINLPTGTFGDNPSSTGGYSQNPTHPITGTTPTYITEVALLDGNKEPLVVAKAPTPIKRAGTQVFAVKLDF